MLDYQNMLPRKSAFNNDLINNSLAQALPLSPFIYKPQKTGIGSTDIEPITMNVNSNLSNSFNTFHTAILPSQHTVTSSQFKLDTLNNKYNFTDKRRAIVTVRGDCKCEVRDKLCNYCDELDDCIKEPIDEFNFYHDTNLLFLDVTGEQALSINSLESVVCVELEDEIQEGVKLALDRKIYPAIGKSRFGILPPIYATWYNDISYGDLKVDGTIFYDLNELASYCLPLSTYTGAKARNYGLYTHFTPVAGDTNTYPYSLGFDLSSKNIGENVDVIVLDSGVELNHPEFLNPDGTSRVIREDWTTYVDDSNKKIVSTLPPNYYSDIDGHGTFCASIIGGNTCGWAPGCRIYSLKSITTYTKDGITVIQALKLIKAFIKRKKQLGINRPTIINNSWGYIRNPSPWWKNHTSDIYGGWFEAAYQYATWLDATVVSVNSLVDEIIREGGIMVRAAGNFNKCNVLPKDEINIPTLYLRTWGGTSDWLKPYLEFPGPVCNVKALENFFSTNPPTSSYQYFTEESYAGWSPNTLSAFNTQRESPVINVGCVFPENNFGFYHENKIINEKSGCLNRGERGSLFIKSEYSNFGETIDLYACGYNVIGATATGSSMTWYNALNDKYGVASGTSFACPQVVGCLVQYLNDNLNATYTDCKDWLYANALSGRIAEFDNTKTVRSTTALFSGSNTANLTSFKLPLIKNYNNYFDEVYNDIGYNNVTILNTTTAVQLPWIYDWKLNSAWHESDGYVFLPALHIYSFSMPVYNKEASAVFHISSFANPDTVGYNWNNYNTPYYDLSSFVYEYWWRLSNSVLPLPIVDSYYLQNPNYIGNEIRVFKKHSTALVYLTSIPHPGNIINSDVLVPKTYRYSPITAPSARKVAMPLVGGLGQQRWTDMLNEDETLNTQNFVNFCHITFKNNTLVVGDAGTDCWYIYNKDQNDKFTLTQVISSLELQDDIVDYYTEHERQYPNILKYSDRYRGLGRRRAGKIALSENGEYLAIPMHGYTKRSYLSRNVSLTGDARVMGAPAPLSALLDANNYNGYSFIFDVHYGTGSVTALYRRDNTTYKLLSTLQTSYALSAAETTGNAKNSLSSFIGYNNNSKNTHCIFSGNSALYLSYYAMGVIETQTISGSRGNVEQVWPFWGSDGGHFEIYELDNNIVSGPTSYKADTSFVIGTSAITNTSYFCGSGFSQYWADWGGWPPGYELYASNFKQQRRFTNHFFNYYENNNNIFSLDNGIMRNFNYTFAGGGQTDHIIASTEYYSLSPVDVWWVAPTYKDLNGYGYTINLHASGGIGTTTIKTPRTHTIPVVNSYTGMINHENWNIRIAYNDKQWFDRRSITYIAKHNESGNILEVEESTGLVYFSVPDNTSETGYKTFTILHGFTNQYPFMCSRWPVITASYLNGVGDGNFNNFYGSSPVRCCFHDSTTFSILYANESLPTDYQSVYTSPKTARFVTFRINSTDFEDGDSNITAEHVKYNKNIFINGHNIYNSPNLLLQPYPKKYIIADDDSETINFEGRVYKRTSYTKYPVTNT